MNKVISAFLYAGVKKEEYESIKADYIEENRHNLVWYSLVVMLFLGALGIFVLLKQDTFFENAIPYFGTSLVMALIMVCALVLRTSPKKETYIRPLIYFFMAVMYAESAAVTLNHPDLPAVTFIGVMMVLPLLFIDRPIIIIAAQAVFAAAFCVLVAKCKEPYIASTDIWNGITFMIASSAEILILIPMRVSNMQKTKKINFLSRNDLLTGVLNRNAYEEHITMTSEKADETLVCIYADVNGLHEINNTFGHDAGDTMLKTISGELTDAFGSDETYRIGGDEFVVLSVGRDMDVILQLLSGIKDALLAKNYYISFGASAVRDHDMDIHSTIKDAEGRMYAAKKQFYSENGREGTRSRIN